MLSLPRILPARPKRGENSVERTVRPSNTAEEASIVVVTVVFVVVVVTVDDRSDDLGDVSDNTALKNVVFKYESASRLQQKI